MTLDLSEAIALAKDLLQTSSDFRPHDPTLAEEFSSRAFEICRDLGIDRSLIGAANDASDVLDLIDEVGGDEIESESPEVEDEPVLKTIDQEVRDSGDQLRDLLQQQALVLQNARANVAAAEPKADRRFFGFFSRPQIEDAVQLRSA